MAWVQMQCLLMAFIVSDRPDPPSGVAVERCRDSSADLKWIKGIENNAPVQYFVVQYNTSFNPDQWVSARTVDYTQNTASIDLQPWANYTFRVVSTNKIGASAPSFHTSKVCTTNPAQPDKNPANVRAIGDKRNFLKIEWIVSALKLILYVFVNPTCSELHMVAQSLICVRVCVHLVCNFV